MRPKVLIMYGGLPHYYNPILEQLNHHYELVALVPDETSLTFGAGVHQNYNVRFRVIRVKEFKTYYNKVFVRDMARILREEKPAIILSGVSFALGFSLYPAVKWALSRYRVKLCIKAIPFREPMAQEAIKHYYKVDLAKKTNPNTFNRLFSYLKAIAFTQALGFAYRSADFYVVYTAAGKAIYGSYGVHEDKIFVIYNSPDTDAIFATKAKISKEIVQHNPYQILHVGRLVAWKRVDLLLEAVAKLRFDLPELRLVVVGDGPEKENLVVQSEKLGITDVVRFEGAIYDAEILGRAFSSASLYVLAGMGGLSINEAMAYGLPVICSVCDGTEKDLVRDGYNGYIFEDGQLDSLTHAIYQVMSNPDNRQRMADNSLRIIREEINIHRVVGEYLKAFSSALKA